MNIKRLGYISVGGGLCVFASGCVNGAGEAAKTLAKIQRIAQGNGAAAKKEPPAKLPVVNIDLKKITPFAGGDGLIVCEPVSKSDTATTAFGTSCARWLHLAVAGQGELGKTPLWDSVDAARIELKKPNLRLAPSEARLLALKLGVPSIVTTDISGNAVQCSLTVRLWRFPEQKQDPIPVTIAGTEQQVLAALPQLATRLSSQLGVPKPHLLPQAATAAEMQFLGQLPWAAETPLAPAQRIALEKLAARLSLAAMQQLGALGAVIWKPGSGETGQDNLSVPVATLVKSASYNTLTLSECAWHAAAGLSAQQKIVNTASRNFPHNYLIATTESCWYRFNQTKSGRPQELAAVQRAARSAARNPVAWTEVAQTIFNLADDVRQSRFATEISADEQSFLDKLYPQAHGATLHATELDGGSFVAWMENSNAATFDGDTKDGRSSLTKAISIRPHSCRAYAWALQIYQPKWDGKPEELRAVVEKIKGDPFLLEKLQNRARTALSASHLYSEASRFDEDYVRIMMFRANRKPADMVAQKSWADALYCVQRYDEAAPIYLRILAADPGNTEANYAYGWIQHYINARYDIAEPYYKAAIASDPEYADAINALADLTYYVHGDYMKAEALYRQAISIRNDGLYHAELARLMLDEGRRPAAMGRAKLALKLGYNDHSNPIWERLGLDPDA